jgi:hypothetical protein
MLVVGVVVTVSRSTSPVGVGVNCVVIVVSCILDELGKLTAVRVRLSDHDWRESCVPQFVPFAPVAIP